MVTVRVVLPLTPLNTAEIRWCPGSASVARPLLPAALEIVATLVVDEAQVACRFRFWVVVSFGITVVSTNVPVAVNC